MTNYQYCTATEASPWGSWQDCGVSSHIAELLKTNEVVIIKPKDSRGYDAPVYKYRIAPDPTYRMVVTGPNGYESVVDLPGKPKMFAFESYAESEGWTEVRVIDLKPNEVYAVSIQEVYE